MKWFTVFLALIICPTLIFLPQHSQASDDHDIIETVFYELCSQTGNAKAFPDEKITAMIAQCDSLKDEITMSNHPKKKVLLFRLKKCRDFLDFTLQTKQLKP